MRVLFVPVLGLRLLRGQGRTGILRLALMVLGTTLGILLLLMALSVQPVIQGRADRLAARTPVCDKGRFCGLGIEVVDSYYGHRYASDLVEAPAGTPAPPGLRRLPRPGEVFLSPALERLATGPGNDLLRQRFPGAIVGTIGDPGLLQPDELLAYVGVAQLAEQQHEGRIVGWGRRTEGGTASATIDGSSTGAVPGRLDPRQVTIDVTVIVLLVPVLLFLATCTRLSARTRDRRLAALRLIGMTPWQTRVVNAVETGIAAIAGSLAGLGVFELLRSPLSTITVDGRGWFAADATPTPGHMLELMLAVPVLAVLTGSLAVRTVTGPLLSSRTDTTGRRLGLWRLLPLVAGAALLGTLDLRRLPDATAVQVMGAGLLLTLIGLAVATPLLAQLLSGGLARITGSLPVLLGARRIQTEAAGISRVVTGLVLLVFAGGFAQSTLAAVKAGVVHESQKFGPDLRASVLSAPATIGPGHELPVSTWSSIPGVTGVVTIRRLIGPPVDNTINADGLAAVVATCADLTALLSTPPVSCREGIAYRLPPDPDGQFPPIPAGPVHLVDAAAAEDVDPVTHQPLHPLVVATVPLPAQTLQVANVQTFNSTFQASLVLPPDTPALATLPDQWPQSYYLLTDGSPRTVEAVRTAAYRIDPRLRVSTAAEMSNIGSDVDGYHFPLYAALIGWGTALALLVAFASIAVATVDRAVERRRHVASQRAIGVPTSTIRRTQLVQVLVPYTVGILCATGLSILAGLAYAHMTRLDATPAVPIRAILLTMLVALGGAVVVAVSVLPALGRPLTPDVLRQE